MIELTCAKCAHPLSRIRHDHYQGNPEVWYCGGCHAEGKEATGEDQQAVAETPDEAVDPVLDVTYGEIKAAWGRPSANLFEKTTEDKEATGEDQSIEVNTRGNMSHKDPGAEVRRLLRNRDCSVCKRKDPHTHEAPEPPTEACAYCNSEIGAEDIYLTINRDKFHCGSLAIEAAKLADRVATKPPETPTETCAYCGVDTHDIFSLKISERRRYCSTACAADAHTQMADRCTELEEALRLVEWRDGYCSKCGELNCDGHTPDCEIGRVLGRGDGSNA